MEGSGRSSGFPVSGQKRPSSLSYSKCSIESLITDSNSNNFSRNHSRDPPHALQCSNLETSVSFGMVCDVLIQIRSDPLDIAGSHHTSYTEDFVTLELCVKGESCWVKFLEGEPFACLTTKIAQVLKRLRNLVPCVELEGNICISNLEKVKSSWKKFGKSTTSAINLNVYGHPHSAKTVGNTLASTRLFLQPPIFGIRSLHYDNPQYLYLPDVSDIGDPECTQRAVDEPSNNNTVEEASQSEIEAILNHIPQLSFLREVAVDERIITPLTKHQREAVDFMVRREMGDLPPSMSFWRLKSSENGLVFYQNVITNAKSSTMEEPYGGILADDMGLGKTLSILAVIVGSLERAFHCAVTNPKAAPHHRRNIAASKITLVIVPSSLLLDSWMEEIEKHILIKTIRPYRYHGMGKRISTSDLLAYDVVLTTYATVASEFCRGQSVLNRVEWYRLVLDEAHTIRNTSTKQFRAIQSLPARIRWCLTGTPIQNGLEDLSALVRFLRTPILDDDMTFRRYITAPVSSGNLGRFANLRRLLEILCLRRTKTLLNLPEPMAITQILKLSTSENRSYIDFGENCKHAIELAVSGHSMKKANHHVIQAILCMRLFCNDGPRAFSGKWNPAGLPSDPEEALSYLQTSGRATCAQCQSEILTVYQAGDQSSGILTTCQHLICSGCLPAFEDDLDDNPDDERTQCPICNLSGARDSFVVKPVEFGATKQGNKYPTKLLALLKNLREQALGDKCIIFSYWKRTLDLVAELLESNGISFFRIHGSIPSGARGKILTEFEQSTSTRILLITFGTGGVGINKLMVANHVHILEPQWNPSIESQAIGRILRLGQEKSVKITRYIMKNTVEEAIQSQQLRKLQLARGGFGLAKDEHTSQRMQEIMSLLCPSRPHD